MGKFLTETLRPEEAKEFSRNDQWEENDSEVEIENEKDFEAERLRMSRDNFILWKDFQEDER